MCSHGTRTTLLQIWLATVTCAAAQLRTPRRAVDAIHLPDLQYDPVHPDRNVGPRGNYLWSNPYPKADGNDAREHSGVQDRRPGHQAATSTAASATTNSRCRGDSMGLQFIRKRFARAKERVPFAADLRFGEETKSPFAYVNFGLNGTSACVCSADSGYEHVRQFRGMNTSGKAAITLLGLAAWRALRRTWSRLLANQSLHGKCGFDVIAGLHDMDPVWTGWTGGVDKDALRATLRTAPPALFPASYDNEHALSFPSFFWYSDGWNSLKKQSQPRRFFAERSSIIPEWESRKPKLVWRGSAFIGPEQRSYGGTREQLLKLAALHPTLLDAQHVDGDNMTHWMSIRDQNVFRYTLYTPGVLNAFSVRTKLQLQHGFAMLKEYSAGGEFPVHAEWWYRFLEPNVTFIPVRPKLTNLVQVLREIDDKLAQRVAANGAKFASEQLGDHCTRRYALRVLREMAKHHKCGEKWSCPRQCTIVEEPFNLT